MRALASPRARPVYHHLGPLPARESRFRGPKIVTPEMAGDATVPFCPRGDTARIGRDPLWRGAVRRRSAPSVPALSPAASQRDAALAAHETSTRAGRGDTDRRCRLGSPASLDLDRQRGLAGQCLADPRDPVRRMAEEVAVERRILGVRATDLGLVPAGRKRGVVERPLAEPPPGEPEPLVMALVDLGPRIRNDHAACAACARGSAPRAPEPGAGSADRLLVPLTGQPRTAVRTQLAGPARRAARGARREVPAGQ
jgi:hypothetical protein